MSSQIKEKQISILLVEDNPGDARLVVEAFKDSKLINRLFIAQDGVEAMEFLHQQGKDADKPRPDLILLDLNLPRKDGREVLAEIKADPELKRIPVVILTTSDAEKDILQSYNLHANCYLQKPVNLSEFFEKMKLFENFWIKIVKLPKE